VEQSREQRIQEQIVRNGSLLRMGSHRWYVTITASGDGIYDEIFEDVTALDEDVHFIEGQLKTDTGFLLDPEYKNINPAPQVIDWEWTDKTGPHWKSKTVFRPALAKNRRISYQRVRKTINVVFFNKRDRDDSLWGAEDRNKPEGIAHRLRHVVDELFLEVRFPEGRFPTKFWPEALDGDQFEGEETQRVKVVPLGNTLGLTLAVRKPYPGYTYRLAWELPDGEEEDASVPFQATVLAATIRAKLASLQPSDAAVQQSLNVLATALEHGYGAIQGLSMVIFAYRREGQCGGLHPVAQYNRSLSPETRIRIGRGLVGQCYRRSADVVFSRYKGAEYYEEIPGEETLEKPAVAVCIPLTCPEPFGLRVGVLMIDTRSPNTGLNRIFENDGEKVRLGRGLRQWYIEHVSSALGVDQPVRTTEEPKLGMLEAGGTHGENN
jgi:hypothetical protein